MPASPGATLAPLDATQRRLIAGIVIVAIAALAIAIADFASGGRPDPPSLRASALLLDGTWQFRTGDDARWASGEADAGAWGTIDMTAAPGSHDGDVGLPDYVSGWSAKGYPGYHGYAWYRRDVSVPGSPTAWDVLGPTLVEDGYELYWNGVQLGGSGTLGANPHLSGTHPLLFALPDGVAGSHGVLAMRVFMRARAGTSATSGGMHSPPILAPRPASAALHAAHWERTIAGYVADAIEPLLMLAIVALAGWGLRASRRPGFLVFASIALALTAARRANNAIVSWTEIEDITTYSWLAAWIWAPTLGAWVMAWNRWPRRAWRSVDAGALALSLGGVIAGALHAATPITACRFGLLAMFVVVGVRVAMHGALRAVALLTLLLIVVTSFGGELLDPLGVPGIWFPFGIGVSRTQYLYAVILPLLAVLIVRTLDSHTRGAARGMR